MEKEVIEKLKELKQLLDEGILTQDEFNSEKAKIMAARFITKDVSASPEPSQMDVQDEATIKQEETQKEEPITKVIRVEEPAPQSAIAPTKMSKEDLVYKIIPFIATAVFAIALYIFHLNYSFPDWWIDEEVIIIPSVIVYAILLVIYLYVAKWLLKTKKKDKL
jgi:hypothetical protein